MPLLTTSSNCKYPIKPQAEAVQNCCSATFNSLATFPANPISPSYIIEVTKGTSSELLSFFTSSFRGSKQCLLVASHSAAMLCVASFSDGGNPSGMVSNWKPGCPLTKSSPRDLTKRLWLNSVFTKVMWKPEQRRSLLSCMKGITWPCAGNGTHTTWRFSECEMLIFLLFFLYEEVEKVRLGCVVVITSWSFLIYKGGKHIWIELSWIIVNLN